MLAQQVLYHLRHAFGPDTFYYPDVGSFFFFFFVVVVGIKPRALSMPGKLSH
jgi:hypothetical protein